MEEDFRHRVYTGDADRETTIRVRRIADKDNVFYLFNQQGENPFRMVRNGYGQWEFEDKLNAPLSAMHLESELIRLIRDNEL